MLSTGPQSLGSCWTSLSVRLSLIHGQTLACVAWPAAVT